MSTTAAGLVALEGDVLDERRPDRRLDGDRRGSGFIGVTTVTFAASALLA